MIRPRGGGFCYTDVEFATMLTGARSAIEQHAAGIVFGVLTPTGEVDLPRTRTLRQIAGSRDAVFHRAFDVTPDPFARSTNSSIWVSRACSPAARSHQWLRGSI